MLLLYNRLKKFNPKDLVLNLKGRTNLIVKLKLTRYNMNQGRSLLVKPTTLITQCLKNCNYILLFSSSILYTRLWMQTHVP